MLKNSMQAVTRTKAIDQFTAGNFRIGNTQLNASNRGFVANAVARCFSQAVAPVLTPPDAQVIAGWFDELLDYIKTIPEPLRVQLGSTHDLGLLPLFLVAKTLDPKTIIESGVFVGSSLRMFEMTTNATDIIGFDVDFRNLKTEFSKAELIESDWFIRKDFPNPGEALAFFDDHIDCAKRILQCRERGIRWVMFDDSPDVGQLSKYRYPAIPSVPLILADGLPDPCTFEWYHEPTETYLEYTHTDASVRDARAVIESAASLDVFTHIFGQGVGDKWLVKLIA